MVALPLAETERRTGVRLLLMLVITGMPRHRGKPRATPVGANRLRLPMRRRIAAAGHPDPAAAAIWVGSRDELGGAAFVVAAA
jgi:hypothetical protein